MKVIRPANVSSKSTIIEVDDNELHLFEMQKNRKVINTVKNSINALANINSQVIEGIKSAVDYYNHAYKTKIEIIVKDVKIGGKKKC